MREKQVKDLVVGDKIVLRIVHVNRVMGAKKAMQIHFDREGKLTDAVSAAHCSIVLDDKAEVTIT